MKIPILHRWLLKYAFHHQSKPKDEIFSKMQFSFIDSNGLKYYTWSDKFDMPIQRAEQLQIVLQEISARVDRETLDDWIDATKKMTMESDKDKALLNVIRMLDALSDRMDISFDEDLLLKLACVSYVDESQDPRYWDEEYEQKKFKRLEQDAKTGLYDFFVKGGLTTYLPTYIDSLTAYQKYSIKANQLKTRFKNLTVNLPKTNSGTGTKQKFTTGNSLKKENG